MKCGVLLIATGLLAATLSLRSAVGQVERAFPAMPCEGDPFDAILTGIDDQWNLQCRVGDETQTIPASDLVYWGGIRDSDRGSQIVLNDGSWLIGDVLQITPENLLAYSSLWGEITLTLSSVNAVIFNPSVDPARRDLVRQRITEAAGARDLLLLENGDVIRGTAQAVAEEETLTGEITANLVFVTGGREVPLPLDKITALVFNPSLATRAPEARFHVVLGLDDGTRLVAEKIESSGGLVQLKLLGGVRLQTDPASLWAELIGLQPFGAGVTYLSDLEPIGYKHIPLLTQTLPLGRDRNSAGGPLRCRGLLYAKGLGMPGTSRTAYALRGQYSRFAAEVALDDVSGRTGSVVFRVFLSGDTGEWRAAYESPSIRGLDQPVHALVDVRDAKAMALIIDMDQRGDVADHAVWLNARLIRQE
jgi:hypothetical protein